MTRDSDDVDLRGHFRLLRERDLAVAPEFDDVCSRAATRAHRARRLLTPMRAWAAASGIVVAAAAIVLLLPNHGAAPADVAVLSLPGGRMPTDSLMTTLGASSQTLARTALPTDALGRPFFTPDRENR
jgi:hypothetical protein